MDQIEHFDDRRAASWFEGRCAGRCCGSEQSWLMCRDGVGVTSDVERAVIWGTRAAEQGDAVAPWVHARERLWYKSGAEQGHSAAHDQNILGLCTVRKRVWRCERCRGSGAVVRSGCWPGGFCRSNLGFMYANGLGVANDDGIAVTWYRKAAEQGDANAQNNLGYMYASGRGVQNDNFEAAK